LSATRKPAWSAPADMEQAAFGQIGSNSRKALALSQTGASPVPFGAALMAQPGSPRRGTGRRKEIGKWQQSPSRLSGHHQRARI
jgi:hypothetical protein